MDQISQVEVNPTNALLHLAILLVTFLGWLSDPFKWLSDLELGDEKVTLNHLANGFL